MTKIHGHLSSHDLTILKKELIAILAAIPTSLGGGNQQHPKTNGGNHHHTATKQKTIKHSGNKGGKLQSSDQQHP